MLHKFHGSIVAAGLAIVMAAGCDAPEHKPWTASDVYSAKMNEAKAEPEGHWRQMSDNAMLSDMAVHDYYFVPHTTELSGTGAERLSRLAFYLDTYGGTVRYDTMLKDEELVQARIDHVREYLEVAGTDMAHVEVTAMMSGGRMMTAREAIRIDEKGTARPQGAASSPVIIGPAPNP
jgi:hypothetical protein